MSNVLQKPKLSGLDVSYSVSNKWIGYFPLENILGQEYKNIEMHLKRFSLPQIQMSSTTVSYKGYSKEIPTKVVNADTKELTLDYIVDSQWRNYKSLYAWMTGIEGTLNKMTDDVLEPITPSIYLPFRVYLLDQYKNKIVQFCFTDCWIKTFNDIALEANNSNEVTHSFTMCYDDFTIESV